MSQSGAAAADRLHLDLLERVVRGAPLEETLALVCRALREHADDGARPAAVAVSLLDPDGQHLQVTAHADLPEGLRRALAGLRVGPSAASCGTAVWRREPIVVTDIATDPLWEGLRAPALASHLAAAWSVPMVSLRGAVLGALSAYSRTAQAPPPAELERQRAHAHLAALAVEQSQREVGLHRSEANFRAVIEGSPDAIWVHRAGRFVYVNPSLVRLLGYESAEELSGLPVMDIIHPAQRHSVASRMRELAAGARVEPSGEFVLLRRDQSRVSLEVESLPITFNGAQAILGMGRDLTERKRMQARLQLTDRLASVGTVAAGLAHELNNPLTYVLGSLSRVGATLQGLSQAAPAASPPLAESLAGVQRAIGEARHGAERMHSIVRHLKAFSCADEASTGPVDLDSVIETALGLLGNEIHHRARLRKELTAVPPVQGNEAKLCHVFLDLLVNATQAIRSGDAEHHEIRVSVHGVEPKGGPPGPSRVVVEISDTGVALPPESLLHIADPFSAEQGNEGPGLRLAVCQDVVAGMGGELLVDSQMGRGTTVRVILSASEKPVIAEVTSPLEDRERHGRVLVVDDDLRVAAMIERALEDEQHVVVVPSARLALDLVEKGEEFDAVVSDLQMPDFSGMDLHEALARLAPHLSQRMLFLSGGAFTPEARAFVAQPGILHMDKPFDTGQLCAVVQDLVGKGR